MGINLPTYEEIIDRIGTDVKRLLPDLDPTIFESLVLGIVESIGGRHFDATKSLEQLEKELFPDTAIIDNLKRWAKYDGITQLTAEQSLGAAIFTGISGTIIPKDRVFKVSDDDTFISQIDAVIVDSVIPVNSITRSGSTVTVTTSYDHNFATNLTVLIGGANETDYNGSFIITVTASNKFTYEITGTPTTPATGTITASCTCAKVFMNSEDTGTDKNITSGATLTFVTQLAGADLDGYVDFDDFTGGRSEETPESLLNRVETKRANPVANFNSGAIITQALEVGGVTRVLVKRITPATGQTTILFVKDGEDNIIPTSADVTAVRNKILEILPVTNEESDVIVTAPTPVETDYIFASIIPNTPNMQDAINSALKAMYEDIATFETDISEDSYRAAIINAIDLETGDKLTSFTLSSPTNDIVVGTDSIGTLGTVSF